MKSIFTAFKGLVLKNDEVNVIFTMHKNPLIRDLASEEFNGIEDKVHLI